MKHALNDYIALLEQRGLLSAPLPAGLDRAAPVELVAYDSREVVPGALFLCKGAHFKEEFLDMAREKGAVACVSQEPRPGAGLPCVLVSDMRRAIAPLADLFYDHPSGRLKVIGITGTKGKSSTAYYLKYILDEYMAGEGKPETGIVSSIDTYDGAERFESHITTPDAVELQRHFAHALDAGMEYLTMEVSSQALKYHRSLCTRFAAACFLNIGYDHISAIEHPDFEDYFSSKLRIFAQAERCCVNLDCEHAGRVLQAAREGGGAVYTFSRKDPEADVFASRVRKRGDEILFQVRTRRFQREFRLTMPGLFNVENALAAIAVCQALEVPERYVYVGLMKARVPGRMEVYANADRTVTAIVDYAHNRLSFETLFRSARAEYPGRRLAAVFGCPGGKAQDRRHDLGEVAGKYAAQVFLTEEDSGEEDTLSICREIAGAVEAQGCPCVIEPNRGEAIRRAVMSCEEPSVLLITGKGAETRQKRGRAYIDVPSDVEYVRAFLQEYDARRGLDGLGRVRSLLALLPALKELQGRIVVAAWDGLTSEEAEGVLRDAAALRAVGARVVLVCGDSRAAAARLAGMGERAVGLSGLDGGLFTAEDGALRARPDAVEALLDKGLLPAVSPEVLGEDGERLERSADDAAQVLAEALGAARLAVLAAADGVRIDSRNEKTVVDHMDPRRAEELLDDGLIGGETAEQVRCCIHAVRAGAGEAAILDGRAEHALLLYLLGQRAPGTAITGG